MQDPRQQNSPPNRNRRVAVLAVGTVLAAFLGSFLLFSLGAPKTPVIEGKNIIDWARELNQPNPDPKAIEIFSQAGPELIPILARILERRPSPLKKPILAVAPYLPANLRIALVKTYDPHEIRSARLGAIHALEYSGLHAADALPTLSYCLADADGNIAFRAANILARIGKPAVPSLLNALQHPQGQTRFMAVYALGKIGPEAAEAIPFLIPALADSHQQVPAMAIETLRNMGRPAVPYLIANLRHTNIAAQFFTMDVLAALGPAARESSAALCEVAKNPDPALRRAAINTLGSIYAATPAVIETLTRALEDDDPLVRAAATEGLARGKQRVSSAPRVAH